jgi:hypothetical protein
LLDHGVLLDLQLPLTSKRLDCLVTGYDSKKAPNAVIIEQAVENLGSNARAEAPHPDHLLAKREALIHSSPRQFTREQINEIARKYGTKFR